jgi:hypothetical protein
MARLPYPVMDLQKEKAYHAPEGTTWQISLHLKDTDNYKSQFERVLIYTRVREPSDGLPRSLELAALRRVHVLLGEQIAAMQSQ